MKKVIYILLLSYFMPTITNAQINTDTSSEWQYRTRDAMSDLKYRKKSKSTNASEIIQGSPYFKDNFIRGRIYVENKEVNTFFTARYNAYRDEIEIKNDTDFDVLIKQKDLSCLIGKELYLYQKFNKEEETKLGYLKTIYEGNKFSFLIRETKKYKAGKKAQNSLTASFPAKYVDVKEYYFQENSSDTAVFVKQKKKEIIAVIDPEYKTIMNKYLKDNHLNIKKNEDLVAFFKHYNTLITNTNI